MLSQRRPAPKRATRRTPAPVVKAMDTYTDALGHVGQRRSDKQTDGNRDRCENHTAAAAGRDGDHPDSRTSTADAVVTAPTCTARGCDAHLRLRPSVRGCLPDALGHAWDEQGDQGRHPRTGRREDLPPARCGETKTGTHPGHPASWMLRKCSRTYRTAGPMTASVLRDASVDVRHRQQSVSGRS